jgi:hypothetical protein
MFNLRAKQRMTKGIKNTLVAEIKFGAINFALNFKSVDLADSAIAFLMITSLLIPSIYLDEISWKSYGRHDIFLENFWLEQPGK